ncbi:MULTISPECIES: low molecular weight protein tyrosine phosphatase family protein [unclassified Lysobacter]|uniref:low molecular weight protein tyrosine phosphatase family protein n=1 Tax=unclassified Lysobacter TaxID=2635362 RepID=UPI001BE85A63|nr:MULTISPECIES: low molecular weight protein tyrosine phosphatase family protein [unclassified Lysobacter]MBT2748140.1 low molecular weight protein tyrosine phosphatase family protein [Lysobacter sp. ISL-42]MBT2751051.1 low molecular weight protein tyrosine phosphatase family protein [Lysobacter sp. ISL-50]MBT2776898.1 low molecular weight protein tyrosine phosphatase family protein [Lysobacter sp. ISL-54]MBT2783367.1 low molecular weight protein tyrosine phosphatase family protein [Lysobacter
MRRVLFVCSQNKLRSPTAEQVFAGRDDLDVASAGLNHDAEQPLGAELVEWAQLIFVMEKAQRNKLQHKFKPQLRGKRVVCLDIPDDYEYMAPALVELLLARVPKHL